MKFHSQFCVVEIITMLQRGGAQLTTLLINQHFLPSFLISGPGGELDTEAQQHLQDRLFLVPHLHREINPVRDIKALKQIIKILSDLKRCYPNIIVHTNSSKAGILGRLAAIFLHLPSVHTVHGWSFNPYQSTLFREVAVNLERFLAKFTEKLIVVTDQDIRKGLSHHIGAFAQYEVIRAVVPLDEYQNSSGEKIRRELNISRNKTVVGSVAVFKPQKAPFDFVKVAGKVIEQCPDTVFLIAGGGPLLNKAKNLAGEMNISDKIYFLGWRKDVPEIINAMDIFILTSLWEGLPQVILQAMMASKPVIANAVDGSREIIRNGRNGYLVSPGCPDLMARRIVELVNDPLKCKKFGDTGKTSIYPEFSVNRMIDKLTILFKGIIGTRE